MEGQTLLIFNNHPSEFFATPLSEVLRLEKFNLANITKVGRQEFINYEGKGLPLLRLEDYLPIGRLPENQKEAYLIIPKQGDGRIGIVVSKVLDVLTSDSEWKPAMEPAPGLAGWAVINDQLTTRLNFDELLKQVGIVLPTLQGEAA